MAKTTGKQSHNWDTYVVLAWKTDALSIQQTGSCGPTSDDSDVVIKPAAGLASDPIFFIFLKKIIGLP